jgi:hypothetical protein
MRIVKNSGPVIIGVNYIWQPEWKDYVYHGRKADGYPNGFAGPLRKAGCNQLSSQGFTHAEVVLAAEWGSSGTDRVYVKDPNHGTGSRPERPAYDIITHYQMRRAYEAARSMFIFNGRSYTYAVVPTREVPRHG